MSERAGAFDWLVLVLLAGAVMGPVVRAGNSDFTYADASRHAMDGVFLFDTLAEMPTDDVSGWAKRYYTTSPALGIGRYPPLVALVQVPFHAVLGVCPFAARVGGALLYLVGCLLFYESLRGELGRGGAAFACGVLVSGYASLRWVGEAMLELPAMGVMLAAAYFCLRLRKTPRTRYLVAAMTLSALAGWAKQPAALAIIPVAVAAWAAPWARRRAGRFICGLAVFGFLVAPVVILSYHFGRANMMLLAGAGRSFELLSVENWLFYLRRVPLYYLGVSTTIFLALGLLWAFGRRVTPQVVFWGLWGAVFYLFFTLLGYKSARLCMFWTPALAFFAGLGFKRLTGGSRGRAALVAAAGLLSVLATFYFSAGRLEGRSVEIREAAVRALELSPGTILYGGERNGTFVFRVRQLAGRVRPTVVRASKVLYVDNVQVELGRAKLATTPGGVAEVLAEVSPEIVVVEARGSGPDDPLAPLREYVRTSRFEPVGEVRGGDPPRVTVEIYRYVGPRRPRAIKISLPAVGMELEIPAGGR